MSLLDDLEARLSTQGVAGIAGTTSVTDTGWVMTKGFMPPDPDQVLTLVQQGGPAPEDSPQLDYRLFQVRVRAGSTGYAACGSKLADAQVALDGFGGTLNSWYYAGIWADNSPQLLGFDAQDTRPIVAQNYRAARSRTS